MVERDMVIRLRPTLRLIAAIALVGLLGLSAATRQHGGNRTVDAVELGAPASMAAAPGSVDGSNRPFVVRGAPLSVAAIPAALTMLGVVIALVRCARQRLVDDGDRWRALLFGAPPVFG